MRLPLTLLLALSLPLLACDTRQESPSNSPDYFTLTATETPTEGVGTLQASPTLEETPTEMETTPTLTPSPEPTPTATPTRANTPTETPTVVPATPVPPPPGRCLGGQGDANGDGHADACQGPMVDIPAGDFMMGEDYEDVGTAPGNLIEHKVTLSAYEMDVYEVSNQAFVYWMTATGETGPAEGGDYVNIYNSRITVGEAIEVEAGYEDHPVEGVTWYAARDFCAWWGKRLPTEAEWEKAARGGCELGGDPSSCDDPEDERVYPWGNTQPNCDRANVTPFENPCADDTMPIGSYPEGMSPYAIHDLAGNVLEWVWDGYESDYYLNSPEVDPQGAGDELITRVVRGSAYWSRIELVEVTKRGNGSSGNGAVSRGFRCAR